MIIKLYENTSNEREVNKSLSELETVEAYLLEGCSIQSPIVRLELSHSIATATNYIYIPEFKRYYYVKDITSYNNYMYMLTLDCDPLMSFKDYIYKQKALIARQEFKYDTSLLDSDLKVSSKPYVITKKFPSGFKNAYTYVLVTTGGDVSL